LYRPRRWSNKELEKFAPLFTGSIVNVSGWMDLDKEGKRYKDYFKNANEYYVSNYKGESGLSNIENEFFLDLSKPVSEDLYEKFDVVFNHTVLEHIFEFEIAFNNLCKMSKDIVILVVPFLQQVHYIENSFGDYYRFTPMAINKLFEKNGFKVIYQSSNDNEFTNIYIFTIASKFPDKWKDKISFKNIEKEKIGEKLFRIN